MGASSTSDPARGFPGGFQRAATRPRLANMPTPPLTRADVVAHLGRQTFEDAIKHGWLKPACKRGQGSYFYNPEHVLAVCERMLAGEYPGEEQE